MKQQHPTSHFTQGITLQKTQASEDAWNIRNKIKIPQTHAKQNISKQGVQK